MTCDYSLEQPFAAADVCATSSEQVDSTTPQSQFNPSAGLRCGGYGSAVAVTSSFAMVAVAEVLKKLDVKKPKLK